MRRAMTISGDVIGKVESLVFRIFCTKGMEALR